MRHPLIIAALALGACAATDAATEQGMTECNAEPAQFAVGQAYNDALAAKAREAAGATAVRRLAPGQMVTMEFRADRLNLETDDKGVVIAVRCG
jgi:hypothetical protein